MAKRPKPAPGTPGNPFSLDPEPGTPGNPFPLDAELGTAENPFPLDPDEQPSRGRTLVLKYFAVPHSGNPPKPYCEHGMVFEEGGQFFLGLQFVGGRQFIYPQEAFPSIEAVKASMSKYSSASWATSPTGPEYDARRFGPGRYEKLQS